MINVFDIIVDPFRGVYLYTPTTHKKQKLSRNLLSLLIWWVVGVEGTETTKEIGQ